MNPRQAFSLIYAPFFKAHLKAIDRKYYSLIRSEIEAQLSFESEIETRNRKPLKRPVILEAEWELRIGPGNRFRVFYKTIHESYQVHILAIGEKLGDQLFIGGKEIG
jgi:mRNA-degrading endonuclease RelE of RelBE toxin-antitoxin system